MKYNHVNMFLSSEAIRNHKLSELLNENWELVAMAPYKMAPGDDGTYVQEYLITLRQAYAAVGEAGKESTAKHVGRISDFK